MRDLINSLYGGSEDHELYSGIIETVEGLIRSFPQDAWRRRMVGDAAFEKEISKAVQGAGLMGVGIDPAHGGLGGGLVGQVLVTDMLAQHGLTSMGQVLTGFSRAPVLNHGTEAQIEEFAVPSISGEKTFCILATEPTAGTNTFNLSTRAVRQGDTWLLNGQKTYITDAASSDYGFLIAKTGLEDSRALSVFILDMKSPGISMQELNIKTMGAERQYSVFFDNVEMPGHALIGKEGLGGTYMFAGLNAERLMISAMGVGFADLALRETVVYAADRKLFGDTAIGAYQGVQHPLAQSKADTEAARLLIYIGAKQFDEGKDAGMYSNMAKLQSSLAANNACDAAIQFHGGGGMDEDTGMVALWRVTRALRIAPINNEMVLNYIAQHCMGLPRSY